MRQHALANFCDTMSAAAINLFRLLGTTALVILAAVALNFVVDPLQLFRPAHFFPAMYSPDSRMQDAGLIRSQDFDTVFMGTSLAIHFRQSDIDRLLGVRSLKLALNGSTSTEQNFVLASALERHPKRVLWEMDDWIFQDTPDIDSNNNFPADLYRKNVKGIAGYLINGTMARESAWILVRSIPALEPIVARLTNGIIFKFPISRVDDINTLRPDFDLAGTYNADKAMAAFSKGGTHLADTDYETRVRLFERDAISLIQKNPDIHFDIYFPPYSILHFVAMREASPATLKIVYDFTAYISRRLEQFPNVSLYDFRVAKEVTYDLSNYADVIHHSPTVDLKVLSWLGEGKFIVDRLAPTAALDSLQAQVKAFHIAPTER
jgi:hypothetical protein